LLATDGYYLERSSTYDKDARYNVPGLLLEIRKESIREIRERKKEVFQREGS